MTPWRRQHTHRVPVPVFKIRSIPLCRFGAYDRHAWVRFLHYTGVHTFTIPMISGRIFFISPCELPLHYSTKTLFLYRRWNLESARACAHNAYVFFASHRLFCKVGFAQNTWHRADNEEYEYWITLNPFFTYCYVVLLTLHNANSLKERINEVAPAICRKDQHQDIRSSYHRSSKLERTTHSIVQCALSCKNQYFALQSANDHDHPRLLDQHDAAMRHHTQYIYEHT